MTTSIRLRRAALAAPFFGLATAANAQDAGPVEVAMHYSAEQAAPLIECFARYEAETGTAVEYTQLSYRDYLQTVLTSRLAGQSPDVYHVYSIWAPQLVDNGVLAEPPDELARFVRDGYAPTTVDAATIEDTLWGVPSEVSAYLLVSNMKLLREAGIESPPTTFEELREAAAKITTRNAQGRIETAGFALAESSTGTGLVHPFYAQLYSAGIDPYTDGFEGTNYASDAAVAAVAEMKSLFDEDITDRSVDAFDFPAGGIGMMIMANWLKADIEAGFGDAFADDVAVSALPFGEDWKTLQYAFFFGVDSGSDVADEAWDVVRWINSPESASSEGGPSCMGETLASFGALTANAHDLDALGEPDAFTAPYIDALESGRAITQPNVMQAAEIERLMADRIGAAIDGAGTPEDEMTELDEEVSDILSEFY